jgi:NADPH-dependent 2,4-dienoyl-CoA reductase/sulfur reductase-like enzyme
MLQMEDAMAQLSRRDFLRSTAASVGLGAAASVAIAGCAAPVKGNLAQKSGRRVIVIGGGWGGATAAKYVRLQDPSIEVILLEPNRTFVSCPFSNLVLSGVESLDKLTLGYDGLRAHGVKIRHEAATAIEPDTKRVRIGDGYLEYDRLIVAPGVDFLWNQVEGVAGQEQTILHAWKAGPQTVELARRLQALPDGGVVAMTVPTAPYRCPPGPYERACQIAWYLKTTKPQARLVVLDANNDVVSKTALFKAAFRAYPNLDYRPSSTLERVDLTGREVVPTVGDRVRYDVLNLIPPQRAGAIALQAGLADSGGRWCAIDHVTFESTTHTGIHVIGDAITGVPAPKSGNIANAAGKICASAVVRMLNGQPPLILAPGNTCYSWVSNTEAIAVVNAYRIDQGKVVQIEQKLTPRPSVEVARNSIAWRTSIWQDILG